MTGAEERRDGMQRARRILFATSPAEGHWYPMVPLAWALRAAGHEVLVTAPESARDMVEHAGLPMTASCGAIDMVTAMRPDRGDGPPRQPRDPAEARAGTGRGFGKVSALALKGTLLAASLWRPDLIVAEPAAVAAAAAATELHIPRIEACWGLPLPADVTAAAAAELARRGGPPELDPPVRRVHVAPPGFGPGPAPADLTVRYVPYNGRGSAPPSLFGVRPPGLRACLTLGTVLPHYGDGAQLRGLVESIVGALSALGRSGTAVDLVVAMTPDDWARLDLPPGRQQGTHSRVRVHVTGRVPLSTVLPGCQLVVHHGGSGTTMTALALGVPQLALPHFADQFTNAGEIAASGVGLSLPADLVDPDRLREAVERVAVEPAFSSRAAVVAAANAALPAPVAIIPDLLSGTVARAASSSSVHSRDRTSAHGTSSRTGKAPIR